MIINLILPEIREAMTKSEVEVKVDSSYKKYVGTYRSIREDKKILLYSGRLVFINPRSNNPQNTIVELQPVEKNVFKAESSIDNSYNGEYVIFNVDHQGTITSMRLTGATYKKIRD